MTNGSNDWGVKYSQISWFDNSLRTHRNVVSVFRTRDILFSVKRRNQGDILSILCCDEYTMGLTTTLRALEEFGKLNIIYVGGGWCGYTWEAKEYCLTNQIGLYVTNEMTGAMFRDDFWAYHKQDERGNPLYFSKTA